MNQSTDVDVPRSAWSSWREDGKRQQLRRPLTEAERTQLEARRDELTPVLAPFDGTEEGEAVMVALADMFGSYRSMRQTGGDAFAIIEGAKRALSSFPSWAIDKVCRSIQRDGVWRDGKFDRQWAPNDQEIVAAVRAEITHYDRVHRSAIDLLAATVEDAR